MEQRPNAFELFNAAVEAFRRGDLSSGVARLRAGFFENLYVAPLLLGEEFHAQRIWYPGPEAEPRAARDYVTRYGQLWEVCPRSLQVLRDVWNDSLVRAELRSFINLSKNLLNATDGHKKGDLLRERDLVLNPERIKRTQAEILSRIGKAAPAPPSRKARLSLIMLASKDPAASVEFYKRLLGVSPVTTSAMAGGYAEFEFEGVHLAIHGQSRAAAEDPYVLGPPPSSFGWGSVFVFQVAEFDRYYDNAVSAGIEIVDSELAAAGNRSFVVKDPSGYLLEIAEDDPKGFETP